MTQRQRAAIIRYWLSKTWFDLGPASVRRLSRRSFVFLFALTAVTPAFSAEPKLVSTSAKSVRAIQAEKAAAIEKKSLETTQRQFPKEAKQTLKAATGTVVSVRKYSISVELAQNEEEGAQEILIRLDPAVKVAGMKKLSDLQYGDRVKVSYRQMTLPAKTKDAEGKVLDMTAFEVALLKTAAAIRAEAPSPALPAQSAKEALL